jgi:hypothetical protein
MRVFHKTIFAAMILFPLSVALAAPASAATTAPVAGVPARATAIAANPQSPIPDCGSAFQLRRSGELVTVTATGAALSEFGSGSMLVYAAADDEDYGPYGASSSSGARFSFYTDSTDPTAISISLVNGENTATLCSGDYEA